MLDILAIASVVIKGRGQAQLLCLLQYRGLVDSLASASVNAADGGLVRSVLACGFYPLVGRLLPAKHRHQAATVITAKIEKVTALLQIPTYIHFCWGQKPGFLIAMLGVWPEI